MAPLAIWRERSPFPGSTPVGTATSITTAAGQSITSPKAKVPMPAKPSPASSLVHQIAAVIGERWIHGADFVQISQHIIDGIANHIRAASTADLCPLIADAIEDHMSHDPLEGDVDQVTECSVEDLERQRATVMARYSMKTSGDQHVRLDADAALRTMLKRPGETDRYSKLRSDGYNPAGALSLILAERRVASMVTNPPLADVGGVA